MKTKKLVFIRFNDESSSENIKECELTASKIENLTCSEIREIKYNSCLLCSKDDCPKRTVRECKNILINSLN